MQRMNSIKTSSLLYPIVYAFLTLSLIINRNEFGASYVFVVVPVAAFIFYLVLFDRHPFTFRWQGWVVLICESFFVLSTILSKTTRDNWITAIVVAVISVVLYCVGTGRKPDRTRIRQMIVIYCAIAFIYSAVIIYNYFTGSVNEEGRSTLWLFGYEQDQNFLSAFICPAAVFHFYGLLHAKKKTVIHGIALLCCVLAIFLTGSRAAFLALFMAFGVLGVAFLFEKESMWKKAIVIFIGGIIAVIAIGYLQKSLLAGRMLNVKSYSSDIRLKLWKEALKAFKDNPIIGGGMDAGAFYSKQGYQLVEHSTVIEIISDSGIIGFMSFVILFLDILNVKKGNRAFMFAVVVGFFVPLCFVNSYNTATFWVNVVNVSLLSIYLKETGTTAKGNLL